MVRAAYFGEACGVSWYLSCCYSVALTGTDQIISKTLFGTWAECSPPLPKKHKSGCLFFRVMLWCGCLVSPTTRMSWCMGSVEMVPKVWWKPRSTCARWSINDSKDPTLLCGPMTDSWVQTLLWVALAEYLSYLEWDSCNRWGFLDILWDV